MISIQIVSDFIYKHFENVTVSKHNTHFHARCAICGDSKKNKRKKRFHLDWKNGNPVFQCWNCGKAGSFVKLYALIKGITEDDAKQEIFSKYDVDSIKERLVRPVVSPAAPKHDLPTFNEILQDCVSEDLHVEVNINVFTAWVNYLKQFRLERGIPSWVPLYYAYKGDYQGRIVIPVFYGTDIIYFQARRRGDEDESIVKYKNPPTEKSRIILNRDLFDSEKSIIVTEGLIDAFMCGTQGTAMLGKELTMEFIEDLLKRTKKHVIIAFDNDEEGKKSLIKYLPLYGHRRLRYFIMPKKFIDSKDINKVVIDHNIQDVYDFIVENSFIRERCMNMMSLLRR